MPCNRRESVLQPLPLSVWCVIRKQLSDNRLLLQVLSVLNIYHCHSLHVWRNSADSFLRPLMRIIPSSNPKSAWNSHRCLGLLSVLPWPWNRIQVSGFCIFSFAGIFGWICQCRDSQPWNPAPMKKSSALRLSQTLQRGAPSIFSRLFLNGAFRERYTTTRLLRLVLFVWTVILWWGLTSHLWLRHPWCLCRQGCLPGLSSRTARGRWLP